MQRPDRFLVLTSQGLHRPGLLADGGQWPVLVPVMAQDVRQDEGVPRVGLLARLAVPLPVTRDSPRVDRIDRQPSRLQRHDDQVLVRLDRHRRLGGVLGMLGQHHHQLPEAQHAGVDAPTLKGSAVAVQDRDAACCLVSMCVTLTMRLWAVTVGAIFGSP